MASAMHSLGYTRRDTFHDADKDKVIEALEQVDRMAQDEWDSTVALFELQFH
jgi:hypothetical protein